MLESLIFLVIGLLLGPFVYSTYSSFGDETHHVIFRTWVIRELCGERSNRKMSWCFRRIK